jgi:hypothetical protein
MKRILAPQSKIVFAVVALVFTVGFGADAALAQSGHFVGTPTCRDIGTQIQCTGKVAGLGGETFTITVAAEGTGTVECTNPAGNVAPGQTFTTTATGSFSRATPDNGQFTFRGADALTTTALTAPPGSCPNNRWSAAVVDATFGDATLNLIEDGNLSDTITVPVTP